MRRNLLMEAIENVLEKKNHRIPAFAGMTTFFAGIITFERSLRDFILLSVLLLMTAINTQKAYAFDNWQAALTIGIGTAENRLTFGQMADATDGADGKYDVPPMLGGDIKAYFVENEGSYWRDIKSGNGDVKVWKLNVESGLKGLATTIKWKPSEINALKAVLTDDKGNFLAEMKNVSSYEYLNNDKRSFIIEISK
jgi:hypothetical protein